MYNAFPVTPKLPRLHTTVDGNGYGVVSSKVAGLMLYVTVCCCADTAIERNKTEV
jgi:hypothetical protein